MTPSSLFARSSGERAALGCRRQYTGCGATRTRADGSRCVIGIAAQGPLTSTRQALDFDSAVRTFREWVGCEVIVVNWTNRFDLTDRPYRGRLQYDEHESGPDIAIFSVPTEPEDPRLVNSRGMTFAILRDHFERADWVGSPQPGAGLSVRFASGRRLSVFVDRVR